MNLVGLRERLGSSGDIVAVSGEREERERREKREEREMLVILWCYDADEHLGREENVVMVGVVKMKVVVVG